MRCDLRLENISITNAAIENTENKDVSVDRPILSAIYFWV
jgi:hypothetical protein